MKASHAFQLGQHAHQWVNDVNILVELLGFDPFEAPYSPYTHAMANFHVDFIDDVWMGQIR